MWIGRHPGAPLRGALSKPKYAPEITQQAKDLVRQGPPAEQDRATWTLKDLSEALATQCEQVQQVSHETVRRWLLKAGIRYRRAKEWLTSPDPLDSLHKRQRDRLLVFARQAPDGAAVWLDQSWFVHWPYRFWAWAEKPPQVAKRWVEKVDTLALYAALDDESQETFLDWATGQPNSDMTIAFLDQLMDHWTARGKRFIVLFWDRAPWHKSKQTRHWIRTYNQRAKREGLTRLILCYLAHSQPLAHAARSRIRPAQASGAGRPHLRNHC